MRESARRERSRPPWYLLTGLLLGLVAGLLLSVWWWPVPYDYAAPGDLNPTAKDHYRLQIARAYLDSRDSGRAYPRYELLNDSAPSAILGAQAQRALAEGNDRDSQALAHLTAGLDPAQRVEPVELAEATSISIPSLQPGLTNTPVGVTDQIPLEATSEPGTPQATFAPLAIPLADIPRATPTLFPTLNAPFILKDRSIDCTGASNGLIQIWVENASGQAIPGTRVQIAWNGGEETFFTGLKPEINVGYADFQMTRDLSYSVRVGENGETITTLTVADCAAEGRPDLGGGVILRFTER